MKNLIIQSQNIIFSNKLPKLHKNNHEIKQTPIYKSKAIKVEDYIDLGTWEEIRRVLLNEENNK